MTRDLTADSSSDPDVEDDAVLPSDGTTIYVDEWRRNFLWVPVVIYGFFAFGGVILVVQRGHFTPILMPTGAWGLAAVASFRGALAGMSLVPGGVRIRGVMKTRVWSWAEVASFELRDRRLPRLAIKFIDGATVGVYGFYTNSPQGFERARAILRALEARRETANS